MLILCAMVYLPDQHNFLGCACESVIAADCYLIIMTMDWDFYNAFKLFK